MRRNNQQLAIIVTVLVAVALVLFLSQLHFDHPPAPTGPGDLAAADSSVHLTMGNPSGATDDPANADNYLMRKPYYALAYNNSKGTANWVSWRLEEGDLGTAPRGQFVPDPDLPKSFKRITPRDYTNSGFDRGHLCPHSDRGSSSEASTATFAMTNIIPQAPAVNQRAWADLEMYCRGLVHKKKHTLYIIAGPQGQGGTGTSGPAETIAGGKVTVPARCWKVILALQDGTGTPADAGKVTGTTRLIAVVMPNEETLGHGWAKYRTSVQEVETLTGYRFFDRVPAAIIDPLKTKVDREPISASRPPRAPD